MSIPDTERRKKKKKPDKLTSFEQQSKPSPHQKFPFEILLGSFLDHTF